MNPNTSRKKEEKPTKKSSKPKGKKNTSKTSLSGSFDVTLLPVLPKKRPVPEPNSALILPPSILEAQTSIGSSEPEMPANSLHLITKRADGSEYSGKLKPLVQALKINDLELSYLYTLLQNLEWAKEQCKSEVLPLLFAATIASKIMCSNHLTEEVVSSKVEPEIMEHYAKRKLKVWEAARSIEVADINAAFNKVTCSKEKDVAGMVEEICNSVSNYTRGKPLPNKPNKKKEVKTLKEENPKKKKTTSKRKAQNKTPLEDEKVLAVEPLKPQTQLGLEKVENLIPVSAPVFDSRMNPPMPTNDLMLMDSAFRPVSSSHILLRSSFFSNYDPQSPHPPNESRMFFESRTFN